MNLDDFISNVTQEIHKEAREKGFKLPEINAQKKLITVSVEYIDYEPYRKTVIKREFPINQ